MFGAGEAADFGHWASLCPFSQLSFWLCPFFLLRCCIDGFLSWKVRVHKRTLRSATPAAGEGPQGFLSSCSVLMHQGPVLVCQAQGLFLTPSRAPHFSAGSARLNPSVCPVATSNCLCLISLLILIDGQKYNIILEGS